MTDDGPERTCVGCRRRRPQSALVRCVCTDDGQPEISRTGSGRGAWLCRPPGDCFTLAVRRKAFERAWRRPVERSVLDGLGDQLASIAVRRDDEKG